MTGATRSEWENTQREKWPGGKTVSFMTLTSGLLHTTTEATKATHALHGTPGPLRSSLTFVSLSLTLHYRGKKKSTVQIQSSFMSEWPDIYRPGMSFPPPCVSEKLPFTPHLWQHTIQKGVPEPHRMLRNPCSRHAPSCGNGTLMRDTVTERPWLSVPPQYQACSAACCLACLCIRSHLLVCLIFLSKLSVRHYATSGNTKT